MTTCAANMSSGRALPPTLAANPTLGDWLHIGPDGTVEVYRGPRFVAIDVENLAGHEGGGSRYSTPGRCRRPRRCGFGDASRLRIVGIDAGVHGGIDDAGRYRVDPDTLAGILNCQ